MTDKFWNKVANLLSVKSIVTICLTVVFSVLSAKGMVDAKDFMTIFAMIITFYFTKSSNE